MRFVSTGGRAPAVDLATALTASLAPDGGLYLPEEIEPLTPPELAALAGAPVAETALALLRPFLAEVPERELGDRLAAALDFPLPLVPLGSCSGPGKPRVLELFHGPTLAFKDVGARVLARLLAWLQRGEDRELTVLVATSGDTGSAVAHAFLGVAGTRVAVLFPDGQVSPLQERQFSTLGDNVRALAVDGTFDDCQRLAKAAFADRELSRRLRLTSANSINLGRLLPQAVYYVHAALALAAGAPPPRFIVPSGNFGNLTAGLLARRLALPAATFVAATNVNDVVPAYLDGGRYRPRPSRRTLSSAMDVGSPSNFARLVALAGGGEEEARGRLAEYLVARAFDDDATRRAIRETDAECGYLADPHTAVGLLAAEAVRAGGGPAVLDVVLATAHPAKFPEVIEPVIGRPVPPPERLAACLDRERRVEPLPAEPAALAELLSGWAG